VVGVDILFEEDFGNLDQREDGKNSLVANNRLENRTELWEVVGRLDTLNLVDYQFQGQGNLRHMRVRLLVQVHKDCFHMEVCRMRLQEESL